MLFFEDDDSNEENTFELESISDFDLQKLLILALRLLSIDSSEENNISNTKENSTSTEEDNNTNDISKTIEETEEKGKLDEKDEDEQVLSLLKETTKSVLENYVRNPDFIFNLETGDSLDESNIKEILILFWDSVFPQILKNYLVEMTATISTLEASIGAIIKYMDSINYFTIEYIETKYLENKLQIDNIIENIKLFRSLKKEAVSEFKKMNDKIFFLLDIYKKVSIINKFDKKMQKKILLKLSNQSKNDISENIDDILYLIKHSLVYNINKPFLYFVTEIKLCLCIYISYLFFHFDIDKELKKLKKVIVPKTESKSLKNFFSAN